MIRSMNHNERNQETTYEENQWPNRVVNQQTGISQSISALPKEVATIATHKSPGRSRRTFLRRILHQTRDNPRRDQLYAHGHLFPWSGVGTTNNQSTYI
jgi:hypothetical protein